MNSKSVSSEMINLEDALSNQNTSGIPVKTFVGYNCGNRTFTILMSLFDMLQYTEVANAQSKNSSDIAQRPLDLKHATAIAKYLLKGLLNTVYNKRIKQMKDTGGKLEEINSRCGKQPYFAIGPMVASFRNCSPNGTNLKVAPLVTANDETAAYKIFLNQGDVLWVIDGQHRRKAAEIVFDFLKYISTHHKYPKASLYVSQTKEEISSDELDVWIECIEASKFCTVNVDIHLGLDLDQERQLFHDLNNLVKKVEKSLAFQFDGSNAINQFMKTVLIDDKFDACNFEVRDKDQSDWGKGGLSRKELVAINAILFLNKTNINGAMPTVVEPRTEVAEKYWDTILLIPHILDTDSKLKTVMAQPVVMKALAKLYFDFFFGRNEEWKVESYQEKLLRELPGLDFSHNNPMWRYYDLSDDQRAKLGLSDLKDYLPSDDEGKNRDLGSYDQSADTFRFGAKHNDIYPIIADMIRWKLNLPSRKK